MRDLALLTLQDLARRCGVEVRLIEELESLGVITRHPGPERVFSCELTLRVRRFVRLQRDLGVNHDGAAVILELLDRIDQLEQRLRQFER
jgi:chaperone modulatory protein CbpM